MEKITIEHLGSGATEDDLSSFREAVASILDLFGGDEAAATDVVWNDGDFASRVDASPRTLRVLAVAARERGTSLPMAHLWDVDWQDWYPLVDCNGDLTGEIIASDAPDKYVVDWCDPCQAPYTWGGACSAAIEEYEYIPDPHDEE